MLRFITAVCALAGIAAVFHEPPKPAVVTPGAAGEPPSDAIVLSGPGSTEQWHTMNGEASKWKRLEESGRVGFEVVPGAGNIFSTTTFGDAQIHVEFATPSPAKGQGQDRGNSGVYIYGRYEVQILDSYESDTYTDGQCGAIYKKHPPLVNACRKPGEWQTYDIVFRAPRFDDAGKKTADANLTVFHNGVLIHDHAPVDGPTGSAPSKEEKPGKAGLMLQDHDHAVKFGRIWVRLL
ncbi:MAG: DUF1080 domain-containing protein [Planctomycetes bacterium]|nr:DUF1080 domain-containing protein [Planctomycetota bacterium]